MDKSEFIAIIPARYASSRMPGKPLMKIGDTEMIVRVCRRVDSLGIDLAVATDDQRIIDVVRRAGFKAVMTSENHRSGTDRVREAYDKLQPKATIVINVQGDEPFISTTQIELLMRCFDNAKTQIATLAHKFDPEQGFDALFDPNIVKLTFADNGNALYFSRSIIPYVRNHEWKEWLSNASFYTHVGIYAYRADTLRAISELPQSSLEKAESLEQLRWLQNGYRIRVAITDEENIGIDTPADLEKACRFVAEHPEGKI